MPNTLRSLAAASPFNKNPSTSHDPDTRVCDAHTSQSPPSLLRPFVDEDTRSDPHPYGREGRVPAELAAGRTASEGGTKSGSDLRRDDSMGATTVPEHWTGPVGSAGS